MSVRNRRDEYTRGALHGGAPFSFGLGLWWAGLAWALLGCGSNLPGRTAPPPRASNDPYVEAKVKQARAAELATEKAWLRLGHWRQGLLGSGFISEGYVSEVDGRDFFLSRRGKSDPEAELVATLRAFFGTPAPEEDADGDEASEHPVCRFPARLMWLSRRLDLDPSRLPVRRCPGFEKFVRELRPKSATLVFSSYYLNNPASAFGHTFLRIDEARGQDVTTRRELLDHGIDYSANVDTGNALIYAIKGVFGLFPGTFRRIPYYYKVREYNDFESRDIWEYELTLTPRQLSMLVAHIWEVGDTYFHYYYMSENCSYHILGLIEAANPDLDLLSHIESPVIPSETVKALYENEGLVTDVRYRPSLRTQFEARASALDGEARALVERLAFEPSAPIPERWAQARRAQVLDAALDLVDIHYVDELLRNREDSKAARIKQRLLERRAAIRRPSDPLEVEPPRDKMPQRGHGSKRVGLGGGYEREGGGFMTFDVRLALHDLADPTDGYPELAQIEFLPTRLSVFWEGQHQHAVLEDFALVRVISLTSQTRFDRKLSWKIEVGAETVEDRGCERCLAGKIRGGTGLAKAFFDKSLTFFATLDGLLMAGPSLDGVGSTPLRLGVGPYGGMRMRLSSRAVVLITGEWLWLPAQEPLADWQADAVFRWELVEGLALSLEGRWEAESLQGQLMSLVYF